MLAVEPGRERACWPLTGRRMLVGGEASPWRGASTTMTGSDETVDEGELDRRAIDPACGSSRAGDGEGDASAVGPGAGASCDDDDRSLVEKSLDVFFLSVLVRLALRAGTVAARLSNAAAAARWLDDDDAAGMRISSGSKSICETVDWREWPPPWPLVRHDALVVATLGLSEAVSPPSGSSSTAPSAVDGSLSSTLASSDWRRRRLASLLLLLPLSAFVLLLLLLPAPSLAASVPFLLLLRSRNRGSLAPELLPPVDVLLAVEDDSVDPCEPGRSSAVGRVARWEDKAAEDDVCWGHELVVPGSELMVGWQAFREGCRRAPGGWMPPSRAGTERGGRAMSALGGEASEGGRSADTHASRSAGVGGLGEVVSQQGL